MTKAQKLALRKFMAQAMIQRLGAQGTLQINDLPNPESQTGKVLVLMADYCWHTGKEILKVSKGTEGLRRLRELRNLPDFDLEVRNSKVFSNIYEYKLVKV